VPLTPAGKSPRDAHRIDAEPLDESGVARLLRDTTSGGPSKLKRFVSLSPVRRRKPRC